MKRYVVAYASPFWEGYKIKSEFRKLEDALKEAAAERLLDTSKNFVIVVAKKSLFYDFNGKYTIIGGDQYV